jgi:TPR repeat protein
MHLNRYCFCLFLFAMHIRFIAMGPVAMADETHFDADAQAQIAEAGMGQDARNAIAVLRVHASKNEVRAQYQLGRCLEQGWGVAKDPKAAAEWYLAAATIGDAQASLRLSALYLGRDGMDRDTSASLRFLRQAANAGCPEAEYFVAWCYDNGVLNVHSTSGVDANSVLLTCLQRMIDAPSPGRMEFTRIAWSIGFQPIKPSPEAALSAYSRAANHGYAPAALGTIGTFVVSGEGDEKQIKNSIQSLSRQDDPLMLGFYEVSKAWLRTTKWRSLVTDDSTRSISKLKELAKTGDPDAMDCLAVLVLGNDGGDFAISEAAAEK